MRDDTVDVQIMHTFCNACLRVTDDARSVEKRKDGSGSDDETLPFPLVYDWPIVQGRGVSSFTSQTDILGIRTHQHTAAQRRSLSRLLSEPRASESRDDSWRHHRNPNSAPPPPHSVTPQTKASTQAARYPPLPARPA
jgi:hypothetical protein